VHWHVNSYNKSITSLQLMDANVWLPAVWWKVKQVDVDCTTWVVITVHKDAVAVTYTTVFLLPVPVWPKDHGLVSLVMNGVKRTEEAHIDTSSLSNGKETSLYCSYSISCIHKETVGVCAPLFCCCLFLFATMAIICHLPQVRNWAKMTGEAHIWVPALCQKV
jgi:hypothetical protein